MRPPELLVLERVGDPLERSCLIAHFVAHLADLLDEFLVADFLAASAGTAGRAACNDSGSRFLLERSFGYVKTEKRKLDADLEHSGTIGQSLSKEEKEQLAEAFDEEPDT
ncbi:hypothetical protein EL22_26220 [Halostagnicola sp. A56]|uniref:hypothetical protein n=1 Tax=Halostagnicola sp. A56 TaxID=1495067 RepID=UPI00065F6B71|nr:hypothetical protein [Halostagnicola sp. A56]KMT45900.1 hypothetical protein EL22_26220 [Halostagnicola sp. A56]